MKYAVLIYGSPDAFEGMGEDERQVVYGEYLDLIGAPGVRGSAQLQPVTTAVSVRVRDGKMLTTDGPFPEMKEYFAGFYIFEADSRDAAVEFAERLPAARMGGAVEVRPIVQT
jgi:hypothetical protein